MAGGYFDPDLDDIFNDLTDQTTSPSSSSSDKGLFEKNELFILELHDLKRDSANTGNPEQKIKKLRKKKKVKEAKAKAGASSSSPSEGSLHPPHSDVNKEEFYDAHESYHGLSPDTQLATPITLANPVVDTLAIQDGTDPKLVLSTGLESAAAATVTVHQAKATAKPVPPIDKT